MLAQATTVLVAFPTLVAAKFGTAAFPAFLGEGLAIARPSCASLLESALSVHVRHIVQLVVNCALLPFRLSAAQELMGWQARWWGGKAASDGRARSSGLRHSAASGIDRDR